MEAEKREWWPELMVTDSKRTQHVKRYLVAFSLLSFSSAAHDG